MQPTLRLLGRHNAFNVRKVLWLLDELELPFTQEDWGRGFRPTGDPEFLALNPLGTVPVLVDGPAVIRESHVILRYLAAREAAEALYPTPLAARARIEAWMDWVAYEMSMPMRGAYLGGELGLAPWNRASFVQLGRDEYARRMGVLDAALRDAPHLGGDAFTLADIPAGFVVHRWFAMKSVERSPMPALEAYYARLSERPAFRRHIRNGLP
ncbi:glutathione S-transferase family protein [Sediminicoccus sp. KRV36]|uniref:glutathione S-transferase family protein n=1 Tax=Sediminicoccus sp. KRV36 TaxID=3133721 RepID=UPI00200FFAA6|nr:glutathione S-transferase family protein [Sediminicoccus rosea]UPY36459.1 glutathione S-transferase family protein [Sediminicoccus rosea]